jgi:hypothetical protein
MGMMAVTVQGREFRYYDNGGSVHAPGGQIIGTIDESQMDLYRSDDDDEMLRSEDVLLGRIKAMALAWLGSPEAPDPPTPRPE